MLATALFALAAYLLGSVSFAVVVSRAFRLPDPHAYGSGNPGATNVLRTGNKTAALLTLLGDGLKGFVAVFAAQKLGPALGANDWCVPAAALAVFLGHIFPVYHRFAGGKGVATAAGIVFALHWPLAACLTIVWLVLAFGFKIARSRAGPPPCCSPSGCSTYSGRASSRGSAWSSRCCCSGAIARTSRSSSPAASAVSAARAQGRATPSAAGS